MKINWSALWAIALPYLVARSKERTTYLALVAFLSTVFNITVDADHLQAVVNVITLVASGVLVAVPGFKATEAVIEAKAVSASTKLGAGSDEA